jgi:hypothetical protein
LSDDHSSIQFIILKIFYFNYVVGPSTPKAKTVPPAQKSTATNNIQTHATNNEVLAAEILWALKTVSSHYSYKSCEDTRLIFQRMFPDSDIAARFTCGERKCAYLSVFGLGPHFLDLLKERIKSKDGYVLLFDEALNKKNQTKQMDFHARLWEGDQVITRYYHSEFMGHCTAKDMLDKFHSCMRDLNPRHLLQLSMDGPNVNWKFHDLVSKEIETDYSKHLLDVGSCGLHTVHGAFKTAGEKSGLGIGRLLSSMYNVFRDSPARREDFVASTGSEVFPMKFCRTRWVENGPAASRALLIWPSICSYVKDVDLKKLPDPDNQSFSNIRSFVRDPLTPVKLAFFQSVATQITPFLTKYQTDKPMLPFLCTDLVSLIKGLLVRFIKRDVISDISAHMLAQFAVDHPDQKKNYKDLSKLDIGLGADKALKEVKKKGKVSEKDVFGLRTECRNFLILMTKKLLEKTPVKYTLARSLSCLDPKQICKDTQIAIDKFKKVVDIFTNANRMSIPDGDEAIRQYELFVVDNLSELRMYDLATARLDSFYFDLLSKKPDYNKLWGVVKQLLLLSHGQATVERGFSVNKELVVENLKEHSLIAQRVICDHVQSVGGLLNVNINKKMLLCAAGARQKYHMYLEEQKRLKSNAVKTGVKRKLEDEIEGLKKSKKQLKLDIDSLESEAFVIAEKAEKSNNLTLYAKSNSFRRSAKEKKEKLQSVESELESKLVEFKNV